MPLHIYVTVWEDLHLHHPNAKKEGFICILSVVLLLPPAPCPGDAKEFRCERESTLFGLPKEDTTRNQWFSCTTLFQNSSTQILECVQRI